MGLSPQQIRAAELISKGHSHESVGQSVGVSRRTILRWLKQENFKNLCYGLVGRGQLPQLAPQQALKRALERHQPSNSLSPQDLVEDALRAVQDILLQPDIRPSDRLKAASLVGEWSGLSTRGRLHEIEAFKVLLELNFVSEEVVLAVEAAYAECQGKIKSVMGVSATETYEHEQDESWLDDDD